MSAGLTVEQAKEAEKGSEYASNEYEKWKKRTNDGRGCSALLAKSRGALASHGFVAGKELLHFECGKPLQSERDRNVFCGDELRPKSSLKDSSAVGAMASTLGWT